MNDQAMSPAATLDACRALDALRIDAAYDALVALAKPRTLDTMEARVDARLALEAAEDDYTAVAACVLQVQIAQAFRRANMTAREWVDDLLGQKVRPS